MVRRAAAVVVVVVALIATLGSAPSPAAADGSATQDPSLGVYRGAGNPEGVREFGTWLGRDVSWALDFLPRKTWADIESPDWWVDRWSGSGYQVVYSIPMLPESGGTLAEGAAGTFNASFKRLAERLVAKGAGDAVLRLGWEFTGSWYRWSAIKEPETFAAYWRQIVRTMRAVPGAAFRFDWCPNAGWSAFSVERAYPGDDVVDFIGLDVYDQGWATGWEDPVQRWNEILNGPYGLQWHRRFAAEHGKPMTYPEWGMVIRPDGHGGGDNPHYVERMYEWIRANDVAYHMYFEFDSADGIRTMLSGRFPKGAGAYRDRFGASSPLPTVAPAPVPSFETPDADLVDLPRPKRVEGVIRLAGTTRLATAAKISEHTFDAGVPVAFVTAADGFADSLAAAPLAYREGGPLLLTDRSGLSPETQAELLRLRPGRVEVLGGPAAVPDVVLSELRALTGVPVSRISGADRYATAIAGSRRVFADGAALVYLASGEAFPDALAAAAMAARQGAPLLLTPRGELRAETASELRRLGAADVIVVGGHAAVSDDTMRQLSELGLSVRRVAGPDRWSTAVALAQLAPDDSGSVLVATGRSFPDAVAAGPYAAAVGAPLLLVDDSLPASAEAHLREHVPQHVVVLGGPGAVPDAVAWAISDLVPAAG